MITSVKRLGYFSVLGRIDWRIRRRGARNKQWLVDLKMFAPRNFCVRKRNLFKKIFGYEKFAAKKIKGPKR